MKKILLLISILLLTGCYDYKELNDLALISSIGIDYEEEFIITLEVINTSVSKENSSNYEEQTILYTGSGKNFYLAYENALRKLDKIPYLYQSQLLILSEEAAKQDISNILDIMLRESRLNNSFYTVMTSEISAKELLETKTPDEPIVSAGIVTYINNTTSSNYIRFDSLVNIYLKDGIDLSLLTVSIKDDEITMENIGIFDDENFKTFLSNEHSETLNLLKGNFKKLSFEDDKDAVILNDIKSEIKLKNNKVIINITTNGTIKEIDDEENLRKDDAFIELSNKFSDLIKEDIEELINTLRDYNSDPLGFGELIYEDNPDNFEKDIGLILDYEVNVDININKNGFLFEVIK